MILYCLFGNLVVFQAAIDSNHSILVYPILFSREILKKNPLFIATNDSIQKRLSFSKYEQNFTGAFTSLHPSLVQLMWYPSLIFWIFFILRKRWKTACWLMLDCSCESSSFIINCNLTVRSFFAVFGGPSRNHHFTILHKYVAMKLPCSLYGVKCAILNTTTKHYANTFSVCHDCAFDTCWCPIKMIWMPKFYTTPRVGHLSVFPNPHFILAMVTTIATKPPPASQLQGKSQRCVLLNIF